MLQISKTMHTHLPRSYWSFTYFLITIIIINNSLEILLKLNNFQVHLNFKFTYFF